MTRTLHERLEARETLGLDNSETMLQGSGHFAADGLRFQRQDIAAFAADRANDGRFDLVFANAALQWVPDHEGLLRRLTDLLAPEGQLTVQVPANFDHPSHVVAGEVASEEPFRTALDRAHGGLRAGRRVLEPEEYAMLLDRMDYREQHVRLQVYGHRLSSWTDVVEWVKGTLLTDYRRRLPDDLYEPFLARYHERLGARLDYAEPYFYPFKRILFWGQR